MWAQYEGYMKVYEPEDEEDSDIFARAVRQLAQTSFPDRFSLSIWKLLIALKKLSMS
jgi:hypothetical protein